MSYGPSPLAAEAEQDKQARRPCSPPGSDVHKLADVITLLSAMVRAYDNPETVAENDAIDAAREGRPAYWTTATYHNQIARLVVEQANREGLDAVLNRLADDESPVTARHKTALLSELIPLNASAINEIAAARGSAALDVVVRTKRLFEAARIERERREGFTRIGWSA
jgi:hypothetical protein